VATTFLGAPGLVAGVTGALGDDAAEVPNAFVAHTVKT